MLERRHISTGTLWEELSGYSRAVRVGPFIYVSGTTAINETGQIIEPDNPYGQTVQILKKIESALQALDASLQDVVRTRVYITDIKFVEQVVKAHHEFFGTIRPANTLVEVSGLASPEILVEVDVDAVVQSSQGEV